MGSLVSTRNRVFLVCVLLSLLGLFVVLLVNNDPPEAMGCGDIGVEMVGRIVKICPSKIEIEKRGIPVVGLASDPTGSVTLVSWHGIPVGDCLVGRVALYRNRVELVIEE